MAVTVTLPDGKALELKDGATGADAAAAIGPGLARAALAVEVSHPEAGESPEVRDLARALPDGARVAILTDKSGDSALQLIRPDAAHVLAAAGRRRILARGLDEDDADAHLRDRVLRQGRSAGAPRADRAGKGARPPQAGARTWLVHLLGCLARRRVLAPRRHDRLEHVGGR